MVLLTDEKSSLRLSGEGIAVPGAWESMRDLWLGPVVAIPTGVLPTGAADTPVKKRERVFITEDR